MVMSDAWRDAVIATGIISSVPTLVLPLIPESLIKPGSNLQRVLLCFAVGGMMGDVFLHLLPHLLLVNLVSESDTKYLAVGTCPSRQKAKSMRHRTMITNTRIVRLCTTRVATPLGSFVFRRCRDTWRVPLQSGRNLYLKRTKNRSRPADADAHPGKSEGHHGHGHGHEHGHDAHGHDDGQNHHHDHHPHQRDEHGHACGHDSQLESVLSGGHHDGHACGAHHMHGGHGHGFSDLIVPLTVLGGFLLFFLSERLVRAIVGEAGGSHNHHHGSSQRTEEKDEVARRKKNDDIADTEPTGAGERKPLKASGVLNLAADALHNLSDGIAIGAAFASGGALGRSTALATLFHELPHEIGDFAVLIESGMSKWQAISAQFCTAAAAFAGTALGLLATSFSGVETYLLAATAGGFVYVSCVAVMPDILNSSPSFPQAIAEVLAMCTGIALMAGVAILE